MITVYGIPNCDTVKKARLWLAANGLAHVFHDFRKDGVPASRLGAWTSAAGLDLLLNRKGTTWRKLDASAQALAATAGGAMELMTETPSVIKRPVVEWNGEAGPLTVGFDPDIWARLAKEHGKI